MYFSKSFLSVVAVAVAIAQTIADPGGSCFTCDSGCIKCVDAYDADGGIDVTISATACKNFDPISWACCTGSDGTDGACQANCPSGAAEGGVKCNDIIGMIVSVPADATTFTINTHDGQTSGNADADPVCANVNQGGSPNCLTGGATSHHCLITFNLVEDCGYSPPQPCTYTAGRYPLTSSEQCVRGETCTVYARSSTMEFKNFVYEKNAAGICVPPADILEEAGAWIAEYETVPDPLCTGVRCGGGGVGDPHFITFDGLYYNYHGECDLVLTESPSFGNGKGLDVHVRTTIEKLYSYISAAAIRIGDEIFEVDGDGTGYYNGASDIPGVFAGYPLTKSTACMGEEGFFLRKAGESGSDVASCEYPTITYTIELPKQESLSISATQGLLKVDVSTLLEDFAGMAGTVGKKGMVARDGVTVFTKPNQMGANWQVNSTQPHLFREAREPQHPQECKLPSYSAAQAGRRLRQSPGVLKMAAGACAGVKNEDMRAACEFDVIQTQNVGMAVAYRM